MKPFFLIPLLLLTSACSSASLSVSVLTDAPQIADRTASGELLKHLPAPRQPVVLAVYNFEDKTGQHKPADNFPEYSRAVTQGGAAMLNQALYEAGSGNWFTVLEREGLNNLVQERKIIRATRIEYTAPDGTSLGNIPPLLYAGVLLEGGIVAYESNVMTGGFGARYLGIGGSTEYRRDIVTVALRAVNVQNGQIILAVNTSKTIFSTSLQGGAHKFTSIDRLLEIESGVTLNEPPQFAVRQAIEMAVYSLVMEGKLHGLWDFSDQRRGAHAVADYLERRDGDRAEVAALQSPVHKEVAPVIAKEAPIPELAPMVPEAPKLNVQPTPTVRQLPAGAVRKPDAPVETFNGNGDREPYNPASERRRPYMQRGVVYCGPGGCVPAEGQAPVGQ